MEEFVALIFVGWFQCMAFQIGDSIVARIAVGIVAWALFIGCIVGIWYAITTYEEPEPVIHTSDQSFIDLCTSTGGTPSRDMVDPEKLICNKSLPY